MRTPIESLINSDQDDNDFWQAIINQQVSQEEELQLLTQFEKLSSEKGANEGRGLYLVGGLYVFTTYSYKNTEHGFKCLEEAVTLGNTKAVYMLALGLLINQEFVKARQWFEKADKQNHALASSALGDMYQHGVGGPLDLAKAAFYYRKSYVLNNSKALDKLKTLRDNYQHDLEIQYHCLMITAPDKIKGFLKGYPEVVGRCIVEDDLLSALEKEQLILGNLCLERSEHLNAFTSSSKGPLTLNEAILALRGAFLLANKDAENKLKLLKAIYPKNPFVQYHCVMALKPQNLSHCFYNWPLQIATHMLEDKLITNQAKYQLFLDLDWEVIKQHDNVLYYDIKVFMDKQEADYQGELEEVEKAVKVDEEALFVSIASANIEQTRNTYSLFEPEEAMFKELSNFSFKFQRKDKEYLLLLFTEEEQQEFTVAPSKKKAIINCDQLSEMAKIIETLPDGEVMAFLMEQAIQSESSYWLEQEEDCIANSI